jgi:hypothetical protein
MKIYNKTYCFYFDPANVAAAGSVFRGLKLTEVGTIRIKRIVFLWNYTDDTTHQEYFAGAAGQMGHITLALWGGLTQQFLGDGGFNSTGGTQTYSQGQIVFSQPGVFEMDHIIPGPEVNMQVTIANNHANTISGNVQLLIDAEVQLNR